MKKLTALLMSLFMLVSLATAQTSDYTGAWYLVSMEAEGYAINPADLGMEMSMILNDDGTALLTMTDEEASDGSWVLDGDTLTVTADDLPLAFMLQEDGTLTAEQEDSLLVFGREAPGPGFVAAAEVAAADITAFDGTWNITRVNAFGMILPFEAMAEMGLTDTAVVIANGSVTAFGADAETAALADGKLVIDAAGDEAFGKSVSLLEDGTLALEYMSIIFYCEKVEVME